MRELIDLSQEIHEGMYRRPFHPEPKIWDMMTHEETSAKSQGKFSFAVKGFTLADHAGTHVDSLYHYDPNGPTIDRLPLEMFVTEAICVDLTHVPARTFISRQDIETALERTGLSIKQGDTFLYYTGHYEKHYNQPDKWWTEYAGLDREATEFLADRGVVNIGCEAFSIDNPASANIEAPVPYPAHQVCKERGMLNTEHLVIPQRLIGQRFTFVCLPLKIKGGTGSPVRAIAILG